jgi:hypothetical protein
VRNYERQANTEFVDYVDINPQAKRTLKRTLLFLHGWPGLWASWKYQIEEFQVQHRCGIILHAESLPLRMITVLLHPIFEVSAHQHTQVMSSHPAQCPTWSAISCVFWSMLGLQKRSLLGTHNNVFLDVWLKTLVWKA